MLTEKDYCDYETCVALKELGFKEKCPTYYDTEDNVGLLYNTQWTSDYLPCQFTDCLESHNSNTSDDNSYIDAPTLWEAQKWLREEKKLVVLVGFDFCPITSEIVYNWVIVVNGNTAKKSSYTYDYFEEALSEGIKQAVKILKKQDRYE